MSAGRASRLRGEEDVVLQVPVKVLIGLVRMLVGRPILEAFLPVRLIVISRPVRLVRFRLIIHFLRVLLLLFVPLLLLTRALVLPEVVKPRLDGLGVEVWVPLLENGSGTGVAASRRL